MYDVRLRVQSVCVYTQIVTTILDVIFIGIFLANPTLKLQSVISYFINKPVEYKRV